MTSACSTTVACVSINCRQPVSPTDTAKKGNARMRFERSTFTRNRSDDAGTSFCTQHSAIAGARFVYSSLHTRTQNNSSFFPSMSAIRLFTMVVTRSSSESLVLTNTTGRFRLLWMLSATHAASSTSFFTLEPDSTILNSWRVAKPSSLRSCSLSGTRPKVLR